LRQAYPEIVAHPYSRELILGDLRDRGLLGSYDGMVTWQAVYDKTTSRLGLEFLEYIEAEDSDSPVQA